jgi:hypothetical protein
MSALTAIEVKLRRISPELEAVVSVLQVAQSVTGLGGDAARTGLRVLDAALKALEANAAGFTTHEELMREMAQAHADLAADRAAEDAAVDAMPEPAA